MSKNLTITLLVVTMQLLAGCAAKKETAGTSGAASQKAMLETMRKDFSDTDLEEGKTVMMTKCNKCHKLFEPPTRTVAKWEGILPSMLQRAKLDATQASKVRAYILLHAKDA